LPPLPEPLLPFRGAMPIARAPSSSRAAALFRDAESDFDDGGLDAMD
jgi:hypothetical protein